MKILLVDDDVALLKTVQRALVEKGYQVKTATEIKSALKVALDEKPDIICADYEMPGGTGLDMFKNLCGNGLLAETRFVLMSGYAGLDKAIGCRPSPKGSFLQKPFTLTELETVLHPPA